MRNRYKKKDEIPPATPSQEYLNTELAKEDEEPDEKEMMTRVKWLASYLDRMNFGKYVELMQKPRRVFLINFLGGIGRGFGMAIGFTLLGFIAVYVLNKLNLLNLPVIGEFIAQLMRYVENSLGTRI